MARYNAEHKASTRRRIIETAARRLKRDGIDGSGIATLMSDAGLTNGAFYAHFSSKEELVATTIAEQLSEQRARFALVPPGWAGLEQIVRGYLSPEHRDNPDQGCPSAALLDEVARCSSTTRRVYTEGAMAIVDDIAARLATKDPKAARMQALGAVATMFGALQLSRALDDAALSDEVLETGVQVTLRTLSGTSGRARP